MAGNAFITQMQLDMVFTMFDSSKGASDIKSAFPDMDPDFIDASVNEWSFLWGKSRARFDDNSAEAIATRFRNIADPSPSACLPMTFDTAGGEEGIVYGSNFTPDCTMTMGAEPCEILAIAYGFIHFKAPALAAAADNDIVVTNDYNDNDGTLTPGPATAKKTPVFEEISPATGPIAGGIEAVITGSLFTPGMAVTIGGHACTVLSETSTTIRIMVPAHAAGKLDVVVTAVNTDADTGTEAFTYV
jgi:hypothetical protein